MYYFTGELKRKVDLFFGDKTLKSTNTDQNIVTAGFSNKIS